MTPADRREALRARAAALGVPAERRVAVADELATRLAALEIVPLDRLEAVPPAVPFAPRLGRGHE